MSTVHYCGFNGFRQIPSSSNHTLKALTLFEGQDHQGRVTDAAICWNYLVFLDREGRVHKHGLVDGKNGSSVKLEPLNEGQKVVQLSATPRHVLVCTDKGQCWTHEEAKG